MNGWTHGCIVINIQIYTHDSSDIYYYPQTYHHHVRHHHLHTIIIMFYIAIAFKDDTFTHNEDMLTMNKIGTIREQYDWQPDASLDHVIEDYKLEQLKPLLDYVNYACRLQSTKVLY